MRSVNARASFQRMSTAAECKGRISTESWEDFNFDWLFDHDRFDHLPIEEQLKQYKARDLRPQKLYKCAAKIWGEPKSRVRRIVAPPMVAHFRSERSEQDKSGALSEGIPAAWRSSTRSGGSSGGKLESCLTEARVAPSAEEVTSYRKWLDGRKALRGSLDSLRLDVQWLARKPDKSPLEMRVLQKMMEDEEKPRRLAMEKPEEQSREVQRPLTSKTVPVIKCPSPEAVQIIEKFLYERKLRLIDLFQDLDKDKNWRITSEEFRRAIKRNAVPLTEPQVEELMMVFSDDTTGSLCYRDLVYSLEVLRKEKKEARVTREPESGSSGGRGSLPNDGSSVLVPSRLGIIRNSSAKSSTSGTHVKQLEDWSRSTDFPSNRSVAATASPSPSLSRSGSLGFLQPPEMDLRPEQRISSSAEAMVDMRRHNQHSLHLYAVQEKGKKRMGSSPENQILMIKTGDPKIDGHCAPSTIGRDPAESIDRYRQLLLREYMELCQLCQEHQLPLTTELLQKTLLYPEDKQTHDLIRQLRQPKDSKSKESHRKGPEYNTTAALPQSIASSSGRKSSTPGSFTTNTTIFDTAGRTMSGKEPNTTGITQEDSPDLDRKNGTVENSAKRSVTNGRKHTLARSLRKESSLPNVPRTVYLSTGKAHISRKVDCWMTFEEFVQLTEHTRSPRKKHKRPRNHAAYWPGQLLDKLCHVLTNGDANSVFHKVTNERPTGHYNNLRTWPINDSGYIQYGTLQK